MVATRRRKSGEKSEDAKEKNGANGTKNGKASKGRSSGGLVAAAAVAVLAVAAGVEMERPPRPLGHRLRSEAIS